MRGLLPSALLTLAGSALAAPHESPSNDTSHASAETTETVDLAASSASLPAPNDKVVVGLGTGIYGGYHAIGRGGIGWVKPLPLEVRVYLPRSQVSIDVNLSWFMTGVSNYGGSVLARPWPAVEVFGHFRVGADRPVTLAVAPGVTADLAVALLLQGTMRLGIDIHPQAHRSEFGVYLRPFVGGSIGADRMRAMGIGLEFTSTWMLKGRSP